jgi:predicted ABC-type exoprotein transport system permease subunit
MRLNDLLDPERVISFLMKLALCLIMLSILLQFVVCLLRQISPAAEFGMLCIILLLSPLAYFIRRWRQGGKGRPEGRRGAERTPVLPQNEEMQ